MTEQEKKELLKDVRVYMTDPKNSKRWKMAPYFSSVVLNFLNNYADKFDDPERIMNVVSRLKVEPFRKTDNFVNWGLMVGNNVIHKFVETELEAVLPEDLKAAEEELKTNKLYRDSIIKKVNEYYENEQENNEISPISLRLNQYRNAEDDIIIDEKGNVNLKEEKLAELFSSLGESDSLEIDERYETSSFYNVYKTLTHELIHGMAHYKSENKAIEEMSITNYRDRYLGGVNFDKLNYIHEGMTEWLAQKAVKSLNKDKFSKIFVSYEPFVAYAEIIHTLFPEGFYDIYFNGSEKLKKYEKVYPDLTLNDLITKYGKSIQNLQKFKDRKEKDELSFYVNYDEVRYQFSDLRKKVLKYAKQGLISNEQRKHILEQMNLCYGKFPENKTFPIDFLTESYDKKFSELEEYELKKQLALSKLKSAKRESGDCEKLTYLDIKQYEDKLNTIYLLSKDKMNQLNEGKAKKFELGKEILDKESEIFDTKIWVLKDGTVGFGDDAIKAFRQHQYDIEDAVMINCKYDHVPQIIKQDNKFSLGKYRYTKTYEELFIRPDYETEQKLSKEQSYSVLNMAISVLPENKNQEILFFDNLEFDEEALKSLDEHFPKIKLSKVSGKTIAKRQKEKDEKNGLTRG